MKLNILPKKLKLGKLEFGATGLGFDFQEFEYDAGDSGLVTGQRSCRLEVTTIMASIGVA